MSHIRNMLQHPRFAMYAALASILYFVAEWVVSASWRGHYGYRDVKVGPLGVPFCGPNGNWPCSALYPVMDVAMVVTGVALVAVALSWSVRRATAAIPAALLATAGAGLAVAGVITEQVNYPVYVTALTVFQVLGSMSVLLIGASTVTRLPRSAKLFAAAAGVAGATGYFAGVGGFTDLLGQGGTERLTMYAVLIAIIVLSVAGTGRRSRPLADTAAPRELEEVGA